MGNANAIVNMFQQLRLLLMVLLLLHHATTQQSTTKYNENIPVTLSSSLNNSLSQNSSPSNNNIISSNQTTNIQTNSISTVGNELNSLAIQNVSSSSSSIPVTSTTKSSSTLFQSKVAKVFNKIETKKLSQKSIEISHDDETSEWKCPNISQSRNLECGCDMPHTLRCSGDIHSLEKIADGLRKSMFSVSLLDCTLKNVTFLSDTRVFENVSLHGLVISSGEIKRVHRSIFLGLKKPLQALGLPNNALLSVPWNALAPLTSLDRLDLSNNRIKALGAVDFVSVQNLTYLELSDNQISSISQRTFVKLKKLQNLKLDGNRLGDFTNSLQAIGKLINLKELNLKSNSIKGPLTRHTLPSFGSLEILNLDRNLLTSIQNAALQEFPHLVTLSLRHNQIDVLQDHAFYGLSTLQALDLGYNGIVAISGASLQHLSRLLILDLTHNFLRALTSDLIAPLPLLKELHLDGNDISIVASNAFDGAHELQSLSLEENPLACDCTLIPFAEWLSITKISSQDLLGAICATPPHLEGAPLLQIPIESLNCDGPAGLNDNEFDNENVMQQLDVISKQSNLSYVKDYSDVIRLKNLHFSADFGIILTWIVNLKNDQFMCDAVFVYKESNIHEILLDNSPIHCESYMMNNENIVSVILQDISGLILGDRYRFCLVLLQEKNIKRDLVVGCSNITKLEPFESSASEDYINTEQTNNDGRKNESIIIKQAEGIENHNITDKVKVKSGPNQPQSSSTSGYKLLSSLNSSFLPGLAAGIFVTSLFVLIWGATKIRNERHRQMANQSMTTCYMASNNDTTTRTISLPETDNRNQYLKLQATTNL